MNKLVETDRLFITEMTADMAMDVHQNSLDEDTRRFVPDEVFETPEDAKDDLQAAGIAGGLQHAQHTQRTEHPGHAQHLKAAVHDREGRQNREKVDHGHEGKRVTDEGQDGTVAVFVVRRHPACEVVQDEDAGASFIQGGEERRLILESERNQGDHDQDNHESVVSGTHAVITAGCGHNLIQAFSHGGPQL